MMAGIFQVLQVLFIFQAVASKPMEKILCVVTLSLTMLSTAMAAERATSIEYEMVGRPANLQPDFTSPPDAALKFIGIKAIDGSRVDAVISQPNSKTAANTTLVVTVHGSGGSYDSDPNGFLVRFLPGRVMPASVSTHARLAHGSTLTTSSRFDVTLKRLSTPPVRWVTARSFCMVTVWATFRSFIMRRTTGNRILKL
jgi:hypothetical protein